MNPGGSTHTAGRNLLFVPGPTNVPERIQRAMVVAMEDHRSSKFPELTFGLLQRKLPRNVDSLEVELSGTMIREGGSNEAVEVFGAEDRRGAQAG